MTETITMALKQLHLAGMRETLDVRLQEASGNRLSHAEFLELLLQDELTVRKHRRIERLTKAAGFRELRTLEDFNFDFNPAINKGQIYELAAGHFVREARDLLLIGPPGVGKSHLAQALGLAVIRQGLTVKHRSIFDLVRDFLQDEAFQGQDRMLNRYLKVDLLIIDDMGLKQLPERSGEYLFEIIMRRHELKSTIMTSNRPIEDWGKLIQDAPAATAILDRFLQHAEVIAIKGRSYRLRDRAAKSGKDTGKPKKAS